MPQWSEIKMILLTIGGRINIGKGAKKMKKGAMIYEGKAKKVFATEDPNLVIVDYKDDATAFNGQKKGSIEGKGSINNRVTNHLMKLLASNGIPTHFVEQLSDREALVRRVDIVKIEVIVRNIAAGSLSKRLGLPEGTPLNVTVLEYSYKDDELGDPMINETHALAMGLATQEELRKIDAYAYKVNEILSEYLRDLNIRLIDFKLEFGKTADGLLVLADEISPDTCRFWDAVTNEKLDKDRFRRDLGGEQDAYREILRRLIGE
jgi:phosphoribosylaminoimidazole-succinocarboxamide synthase